MALDVRSNYVFNPIVYDAFSHSLELPANNAATPVSMGGQEAITMDRAYLRQRQKGRLHYGLADASGVVTIDPVSIPGLIGMPRKPEVEIKIQEGAADQSKKEENKRRRRRRPRTTKEK